jgi:hypothetical protein
VLNVTDHLAKLWEDQLKGYDVEEQGLRVMLDEAVVERTKSEVSQDKQILAEWETLLFGKREVCSSFYRAAEWDVDAFVTVRYSERGRNFRSFQHISEDTVIYIYIISVYEICYMILKLQVTDNHNRGTVVPA